VIIQWRSVVDFVVLAAAVSLLLRWSHKARALRFAVGILALRLGALLARQLDLSITAWILDAVTVVAILALLVVFQPEFRRVLMRFDIDRATDRVGSSALAAVTAAAYALARMKCGALFVLARKDSLAELTTTGVVLNGELSTDILVSIFQKASPIHDGAAIIEGHSITRVGAVLPLSLRAWVPGQYGTRHRAAMGLAERSDALVIAVSEERGEVTLIWDGHARSLASERALLAALESLITQPSRRPGRSKRPWAARELALQAAALGLAALIWGIIFLVPGRSVLVRAVPVEFTHVPPGLLVAGQSADTAEVWLRGNAFLLDTLDLNGLVAQADLARAHAGLNAISLDVAAVETPVGIKAEYITPRHIEVQLSNRSGAPVE
jgi:uncharacterized protein (TIGR00159 family)